MQWEFGSNRTRPKKARSKGEDQLKREVKVLLEDFAIKVSTQKFITEIHHILGDLDR